MTAKLARLSAAVPLWSRPGALLLLLAHARWGLRVRQPPGACGGSTESGSGRGTGGHAAAGAAVELCCR